MINLKQMLFNLFIFIIYILFFGFVFPQMYFFFKKKIIPNSHSQKCIPKQELVAEFHRVLGLIDQPDLLGATPMHTAAVTANSKV